MTLVRLLPLQTEPALIFPPEGRLQFKKFKFDLRSLESRQDKFEFEKHKEKEKSCTYLLSENESNNGLIT